MVKVRVCLFYKSFWAEQRRRTLVNYLITDILLQLFTKLTVFGLTSQPGNELVHWLFARLFHLTEDVSLVRCVELWREVSIQCPHGNIVSACRVICIATRWTGVGQSLEQILYCHASSVQQQSPFLHVRSNAFCSNIKLKRTSPTFPAWSNASDIADNVKGRYCLYFHCPFGFKQNCAIYSKLFSSPTL